MKIFISPKDNVVTVDGVAKPIDTSALPQTIMSITYDTTTGLGIVNDFAGSVPFADFTPYQATLDAWTNWVMDSSSVPAFDPNPAV